MPPERRSYATTSSLSNLISTSSGCLEPACTNAGQSARGYFSATKFRDQVILTHQSLLLLVILLVSDCGFYRSYLFCGGIVARVGTRYANKVLVSSDSNTLWLDTRTGKAHQLADGKVNSWSVPAVEAVANHSAGQRRLACRRESLLDLLVKGSETLLKLPARN